MGRSTCLLLGFAALLCCATATFASTTLTYSGSNLNAGAGTMTITCTDSVLGNLWSLEVQETSTFAVAFPQFEDLTDAGVGGVHFNYSGPNVRGGGIAASFFNATKNGSATKVFTELTKTSSEYQCQVAETVTFSGPKVVPITDTYTIVPSATAGANLISCTSTFTNNSSPQRALTESETGSMMAFECWMNCNPWGGNGSSPTGEFSSYATTGAATGSRTMVKTSDGVTPTIYQVWDNFNKTSPLYVVPPSYPSDNSNTFATTTEVLNNTITSGLGITAGRTFTYNVDMAYTNVADPSNRNDGYANCLLETNAAYPDVDYRVGDSGTNWGYNVSGIAINQAVTHTAALTVNISNYTAPPVFIPGADEAIEDTNGTGNMNVTLNGSASTGTITSWAWYLNGSSTAIATTENPTVSLPLGIDDMELTVSGPGGTSSAVQRVWIYPTPTYWVDGLNGNDSNNGFASTSAYKTINEATSNNNSHSVGAGGVVMVVGDAIYRGTSTSSAVVSTFNSGTSTSPIILMGMPLQRVIVDGSSLVTGWTQCPSTLNSNYASIWYTTITGWPAGQAPHQVTQTETVSGNLVETELVAAGLPSNAAGSPPYLSGYNFITGGTQGSSGVGGTISDSVNLAGNYSNNYFNGASINYNYNYNSLDGFSAGALSVTAYNNTTGTLTLNTELTYPPTVGTQPDAYNIYNLPQLLSAPGQFAVVPVSSTSYTVYVWLTDSSNPGNTGTHVAVNGKYESCISVGTRSYWQVDNFEVRHAWASPTLSGENSYGVGYNNAGPGMIARNCLSYLDEGWGVGFAGSAGALVTHCTSEYCYHTVALSLSNTLNDTVTVENCEVANSTYHGIDFSGQGTTNNGTMTIDGCYIHNHTGYNHADAIQAQTGQFGTVNFTNTLQFNNLDFYQYSAGPIGTFNVTNDVFVGGNYFHFGTDTAGGFNSGTTGASDFQNNTAVCASANAILWGWQSGATAQFDNNVTFQGNYEKCFVAGPAPAYTGDYNDWYMFSGETDSPVGYGTNYQISWSTYLNDVTPQDAHSYGNTSNANPLFTNMPATSIAIGYVWNATSTTIPVGTANLPYLAVNDNIEIGWDGVMRQITAINSTTGVVTFSPGKSNLGTTGVSGIIDFQTGTNPTFNLAFQSGSPCIGTSSTRGNMGSSLNVANYQNGDFNGDGRRDIPAYPPTMTLPPG